VCFPNSSDQKLPGYRTLTSKNDLRDQTEFSVRIPRRSLDKNLQVSHKKPRVSVRGRAALTPCESAAGHTRVLAPDRLFVDYVYFGASCAAGLPQEALRVMSRIVLGREFHEDAVNPKPTQNTNSPMLFLAVWAFTNRDRNAQLKRSLTHRHYV
jgi:hypothetical protein